MEDNTNIRIRLQRADEGFSLVEVSLPEQPLKRSRTETSSEEEKEDFNMDDAPLVPLPDVPETAELPPLQPMQSVLFNASNGNQDADAFTNVPYTGPVVAGIRPEAANYPVLVPSYSSWFDMEKVHQNEIRALPEFFNAEKPQDQEKYKRFRNFIVEAFRANPRVYLSATSCRKLLAADACSVLRIHNFLESWGLINYLVDPGTLPLMSGPSQGSYSKYPVFIHSAHSGLVPVGPPAGQGERESNKSPNRKKKKSVVEDLIDIEESAASKFAVRKSILTGGSWNGYTVPGELVDASKCISCQANLEDTRYIVRQRMSTKTAICPECFNSGKYPPELSHDDFVLVKGDVNLNESDSWTEEERLLLLEGLETHGEDWDAVAAHVGKSKRECMEYFVRMPIEDTFLEQSDNFIGIKHKEQTDQTTEYLPFGDLGNPVLAQVAFIASMISPAVGAAAAAKAVEKISVMKKSEDDQNASSQMVVDDVDEGSLAAGKKPFLTSEEIKEVSLESIASAALKAKDLSEKEFKQIVSAVLELVSIQMKKTELKMKHFETIDLLMTREKEHLEKCRQKLFAERMQLADARLRLQQQAQQVAQQRQALQSSSQQVVTEGSV